MDDHLLAKIASEIGELKGMVTSMQSDIVSLREEVSKGSESRDVICHRHDKRLRKIENKVVPVILGISVFLTAFGQKIIEWFGGK